MAGRISDWVTDRKWQMSESLALGIVLTLAGGFQDAYSYNCRGKVFANAQTGNIVLLGQNLATGNWQSAVRYLLPILAFIGGVYVTEWIRELYKDCLLYTSSVVRIESLTVWKYGSIRDDIDTGIIKMERQQSGGTKR